MNEEINKQLGIHRVAKGNPSKNLYKCLDRTPSLLTKVAQEVEKETFESSKIILDNFSKKLRR